jgi:hypothetical protein
LAVDAGLALIGSTADIGIVGRVRPASITARTDIVVAVITIVIALANRLAIEDRVCGATIQRNHPDCTGTEDPQNQQAQRTHRDLHKVRPNIFQSTTMEKLWRYLGQR